MTVASPSRIDRGGFADRLRELVRPEFAVEVILPQPNDVVLGTPMCAVPACGRSSSLHGFCQAHYRRWHLAGRPQPQAWATTADPAAVGHRPLATCRAPGCRFGQHRDQLCYKHSWAWRRAWQPEMVGWLDGLPMAVSDDTPVCAVAGCDLLVEWGEPGLCAPHRTRWRGRGRPELAEYLFWCANYGEPRFDLRGLTMQVRLEIQYVLQCRADERTTRTTPRSIRPVLRYLAQQKTRSLLAHSADFWVAQVTTQIGSTSTMRAFLRYAIDILTELRDGHGWDSEYHADVWQLARLGLPVSRRARFDFRPIRPVWLRDLVKRWLRWRISNEFALTQIRKDFTALTRLATLTPGLAPRPPA